MNFTGVFVLLVLTVLVRGDTTSSGDSSSLESSSIASSSPVPAIPTPTTSSLSLSSSISSINVLTTTTGAVTTTTGAITTSTTTGATTSLTPTSVWATGIINGLTTTYLTIYSQSFKSAITQTVPVPSGDVGMGSLSGEVGQIRTYSTTVVASSGSSLATKLPHGTKSLSFYPFWVCLITLSLIILI